MSFGVQWAYACDADFGVLYNLAIYGEDPETEELADSLLSGMLPSDKPRGFTQPAE